MILWALLAGMACIAFSALPWITGRVLAADAASDRPLLLAMAAASVSLAGYVALIDLITRGADFHFLP